MRKRYDSFNESRDRAVVLLGTPPAVDDFVEVGHNFGRLAEYEEQGNEYQHAGQVVLTKLAAAWTFLSHLR